MSIRPSIFISLSLSPYFNLAFESFLFSRPLYSAAVNSLDNASMSSAAMASLVDPASPVLFLYRNSPCLILGRFQNPWKEVNVKEAQKRNVQIVRRMSGGGCVYQDEGCNVWGFVGKREPNGMFAKANNEVMVKAMQELGVEAKISGRNDIEVEGQKVSGAAFQHKGETTLHHGTVLVNLNLNSLDELLNVNPLKLAAKGVSSVKSRVMNLSTKVPGLRHEMVDGAILSSFLAAHNAELDPAFIKASLFGRQAMQTPLTHYKAITKLTADAHKVTPNFVIDAPDDPLFRKTYEQLTDWNWIFGKTPPFTNQIEKKFDWALMEMLFDCDKGLIKSTKIFSDCLYVPLLESAELHLAGIEYSAAGIRGGMEKVLAEMIAIDSPAKVYVPEWTEWILSALKL